MALKLNLNRDKIVGQDSEKKESTLIQPRIKLSMAEPAAVETTKPKSYGPTISERENSVIGQLATDSKMAYRAESRNDNSLWQQTETDRVELDKYTEKLMKDLNDQLTKYRADNDTDKIVETQKRLTELQKQTDTHWTDRVGNTVGGALKQSAGAYGSAFAVTTEDMLDGGRANVRGESMDKLSFDKNKALQYTRGVRDKTMALTQSGAADIEQAKKGLGTVGRLAVDTAAGLTQLGTDILIGGATHVGAMPVLAVRAFGGAADQAKMEGASVDQQVAYGLASATVELATEKLFSANIISSKAFGKGAADDLLAGIVAGLEDVASTPNGRALMNRVGTMLTSGISEGLEEGIAAVVEPISAKLAYGKDMDWDAKEIGYQVLIGALTGAITGISGQNTNEYRAKVAGQQIGQSLKDSGNLSGIVRQALHTDKESAAYKKADEIRSRKTPATNQEITELARLTFAQVAKEQAEQTAAVEKAQSADLGQPVSTKTATVLDTGTSAYVALGMKTKRAEAKAKVVQKLINGEQVSLDGMKSLNLTDAKYREIFTQLTGVQFPEGLTNLDQLINIAKTANTVSRVEQVDPGTPVNVQTEVQEPITQPVAQVSDDAQPLSYEQFGEAYRRTEGADLSIDEPTMRSVYDSYLEHENQTVMESGAPVTRTQFRSNLRKTEAGAKMSDREIDRYFDSYRESQTEAPKDLRHKLSKDVQDVIAAFEKKLGIRIEVTESIRSEKTGQTAEGVSDTGIIRLALDARGELSYDEAVMQVLRHEVTHQLKRAVSEDTYNAFAKYVREFDAEFYQTQYEKVSKTYDKQFKGSDEAKKQADIDEEVIARCAEKLFEDEAFIRMVVGKNRTLAEKIHDIFEKLLKKLNLTGEAKKQLQAKRDLWAAMLNEAEENTKKGIKQGTDEGGNTQYSISSLSDAMGVQASKDENGHITFTVNGTPVSRITTDHIRNESGIGLLIKTATDNGFISAEDAEKQFSAAAELMNTIIRTEDPEMIWAYAGATMFSALKSNADGQYGTTVDFTTVCRKTQDMVSAMSHAMVKRRKGLTKEEITELQAELLGEGSPVPCPVCYVFSRWAGVGSILDNMYRWQNTYEHYTDDQIEARIQELRKVVGEKKDLKALLREQDQTYFDLTMELERNTQKIKDLREAKKDKATKKDKARIAAINDQIKNLDARNKEIPPELKKIEDSMAPELAWLEGVRSDAEYADKGHVNPEVLFNLDAGDRFASQYPLAWGYRTSRGPSAGKAIVPYSDMVLGDLIGGIKHTAADGDETFKGAKGSLTKDQKAAVDKALARTRAQNLIGGQRFQSTSDFRYEYALDYIQAFWELQALGSNVQTYTKIVEFAEFIASVGGDVNLSVMPKDKGYENGHLIYSNVTGVDFEGALKVAQMFDNAQLILVGVNDEHIRLALEDSSETGGIHIGFVIPYHASGASDNFIAALVQNLGETYQAKTYTDYSKVQSDKELEKTTPDMIRRNNLRSKLLKGTQTIVKPDGKKSSRAWEPTDEDIRFMERESKNARSIVGRSFEDLRSVEKRALEGDADAIKEYKSWTADVLWNLYQKMWNGGREDGVRLNSAQAKSVMPHEYWNKTVSRDQAYINGFLFRSYCYSMGLKPRFTGIEVDGKYIGDFSDSKGYWKTLIDRPMYANDGTYRDQQKINVTDFNQGMLTAEYGEEHWGEYKVAEPDLNRAQRAAERWMRNKNTATAVNGDGQYSFADESSEITDEAYLSAVERGDMETAQRMVDEAAKAAGYNRRGYRGEQTEWNAFDMSKAGTGSGAKFGKGVYLALDRSIAEEYAYGEDDDDDGVVREFYAKLDTPYIFDYEGEEIQKVAERWFETLDRAGFEYDRSIKKEYQTATWGRDAVSLIEDTTGEDDNNTAELLSGLGYDGVISYDGYELVVFNPAQVKSTDPVTYDEDNNVIPLSKRFDSSNKDIRYSFADEYVGTNPELAYLPWENQVDLALSGKFNDLIRSDGYTEDGKRLNSVLYVAKEPTTLLQEAGLSDLPLIMTQQHLRSIVSQRWDSENPDRVVNWHNHEIDPELVKKVPEFIRKPVAIFKSEGKQVGGLVILTSEFDSHGNPICVFINPDQPSFTYDGAVGPAHFVNMYGLEKFDQFLQRAINNDGIIYQDKKMGQHPAVRDTQTKGVSSGEGLTSAYNTIVREKDPTVKPGERQFSLVEDQETLDFLNNQEWVKVYRAMWQDPKTEKLYPPMGTKQGGKLVAPIQEKTWYRADERPELIKFEVPKQYVIGEPTKQGPRKGKRFLTESEIERNYDALYGEPDVNATITLDSGKTLTYGELLFKFELKKADGGTDVPAAYNPYFHTSMSALNDQFSSAYKRPGLVVVEGYIPKSELTDGYRAKFAKDPVGETTWHEGPVAAQLKGDKARKVYLSRWFRAERVVKSEEAAKMIAETLDGEDISIPWNVVTPDLLKALDKTGVPVDRSVVYKGTSYEDVYGEQQYSFADDEAYLSAVERGDMETAQRMVDEAAKMAGFPARLLHGTQKFGFTVADTSLSDDKLSFFATNDVDTAKTYSSLSGKRGIAEDADYDDIDLEMEKHDDAARDSAYDLADAISSWAGYYGAADADFIYNEFDRIASAGDWSTQTGTADGDMYEVADEIIANLYDKDLHDGMDFWEWQETDDGEALYTKVNKTIAKFLAKYEFDTKAQNSGNYDLYANTDGLLVIDGNGAKWNDIKSDILPDITSEEGKKYGYRGHWDKWTTRSISKYASDNGYRGVLFKNIYDDGGKSSSGIRKPADVYSFFYPQEQVKSADPVTYDDNGNVIPLSKRFDSSNEDIRYSLADDLPPEKRKAFIETFDAEFGEGAAEQMFKAHDQMARAAARAEKRAAKAAESKTAAETLAKEKSERDLTAFLMYHNRKLREQQRKYADDKAKLQKAKAEAVKEAVETTKLVERAKADIRVQATEMHLGKKAAEQKRTGNDKIVDLKAEAADRLRVTKKAYRDEMSRAAKLQRNAAKHLLSDKKAAEKRKNEIQTAQGPVDTIRKNPRERVKVEKMKALAQELRTRGRTAYRYFVNQAQEIDNFAKRQKGGIYASTLVNVLGGSGSTVESIFKNGLVDRSGNRIGESLKDVLLCMDSTGKKVDEAKQALLQDYILHLHNIDRMSFVAKAKARLDAFEGNPENAWLVGLDGKDLAMLVAATDKETADAIFDKYGKIKKGKSGWTEADRQLAWEYASLLHNYREAQDKPVFADENGNPVTADTSREIVAKYEKDNAWLIDKANGIFEWWDLFMRNWAVGDSLSLAEYETMHETYPHYAPTYRVDKAGPGGAVSVSGTAATVGKATKAAKGSTLEIVPIEDSFANIASKIVRLARVNELYMNIIDTAMLDEEGLFSDMAVFDWDWQTGEYEQALQLQAILNGETEAEIEESAKAGLDKDGANYKLTGWSHGRKYSAWISEDLYKSIADTTGATDEQLKKLTKLGNTLTGPMKTAITGINPFFAIRNLSRDIPSAIINSTGGKFPKYWAQAIAEMKSNSENWQAFKALGGTNAGYYNNEKGFVDAMAKGPGVVKTAIEGLGWINNVTEAATRFAEYLSTIDRMGDTYEARLQGIKNSAEVTVDFSRKGSYGKFINAWVPYWNPAVQGIDKMIRSVVESPDGSAIWKQATKTLGRAATQTILFEAILQAVLHALDRDDEWEKLSDRDKAAYYCIPLWDEHKFLKIAKNREWGAILGTPFMLMLEGLDGRQNPFENYVETALEPNFLPGAILRPREGGGFTSDVIGVSQALDLAYNEDFAGRTIIPYALQQGSKTEQYDSETSRLSVALGKLINFSPMQIDYIVKDYFGDFGELFTGLTAPGTYDVTPEQALKNVSDIFTSSFHTDNRYSNQTVSTYYETLDELGKVVNDKKNQMGTEAHKQTKEYKTQKGLQEMYGNRITELNKEVRGLPDGPDKDALKEEIAQLAGLAMDFYKQAMSGEIKEPLLTVTYANLPESVSNELIRLDSFAKDYAFEPTNNTTAKYTDPEDKQREYILDDESKEKRSEIYSRTYGEVMGEIMNKSEYRKANDQKKVEMLEEARDSVAKLTKDEFLDWLAANRRSTLKK